MHNQLIESNERYRLLVESVTDYAIYMLDPSGIVVSWNPGARRFKGYEEAEILGHHFSRFYTDEDRATDLPKRALETAVQEGRFEQEGWRVRKDGTRMWAHVVIDPVRDADRNLIGFAKITRDITARKTAEQELRKTEERFRILVQGVKDYAIYMLDPEGRITNWNTGAQHLKGYTESETLGDHFSRFYPEEDRATGLPARALETATREGRFEHQGWRVRKDGTRFWADVVIDAIRDDDGMLLGFAKITRDVTERMEAQRRLDETRAQLLQAQKMEAVGQLTGGIAHDFNNLLAVILGSLDLMRKRLPSDPRLQQFVENSIQAAERGASLTQRLLAFSRQQELKTEAIDVPQLVRGMADLLQRSIGPMVQIDTRFPLSIDQASADPRQLELALLNLVVNARDAMPDGGLITVSMRNTRAAGKHGLQAGEYVCLSVTDTGEGMDEETLARAVEPFFTTKGVGKGTGLGLSMIHGFAEQSKGALLLKSTKGQGTTAELWLPVAAPSQSPLTSPEPLFRQSPAHARLSILVVDDDDLVLMNTTALLEDLGHHVIEANSGEQALRILKRERPDLVITDQLMPGMSGTDLIAQIRSKWPGLPVVLGTGYADIPAQPSPSFYRLSKPFTQADLARAIEVSTHIPSEDRVIPFRQR